MLKDNELKNHAVSGMVWKLLEKGGMNLAQFVIQIVLARLLLPEEYGLVGLLSIFIVVSDVFIQQGMTTALIQKKDADQIDFSSVYFANIVLAVVLYIILFFISPYVADFYSEPKLVSLMRILSINVVFGAFGAVHGAILAKVLDFKRSFYRSLFNTATQGVVGIAAALMGLGAYSLVISKICGTLVGTFVLCITVKWKPSRVFSGERVKKLFDFSSKVLTSNLLNTLFNNLHSLIIGRYYTSADLGYYQRGQQIPQAAISAIDGSFSEVLYPTLSIVQDDLVQFKNVLRRSMKSSMYVVFPVLMGIIATAETLTLVLLTEKWLPCVPFIQLQCIICMFWPLSARTHALNAIGRSDVVLKLSVISKVVTLLFIVICIRFGIYAIMLGTIATSITCFAITSYYVDKYVQYSMSELLKDILPNLLLSLFMMIVVTGISLLKLDIYSKLILQVIVGVIVYVGASVVLKNDSFYYLLDVVKRMLVRKKGESI